MTFIYCGERVLPPEPEPTAAAWLSYVPATDAELKRLLKIVKDKYPKLVPLDDLEPFKVAFAFVSQCRRAEEPDRRYFASHWGELAERFAKSIGAPTKDVDAMVFAAVIAAGDVPFSLRTDGRDAAIGLAEAWGRPADRVLMTDRFGNPGLVKCEPAWKDILRRTRSLREPDKPPPLQDSGMQVNGYRVGEGRLWSAREPWDPAA